MQEYILVIKIPNIENEELIHPINLSRTHEIYPEDFFRVTENRNCLYQTILAELSYQINNSQLDRIIAEWMREIKDGNRRAVVVLDIPPEVISKAVQPSNSTNMPEFTSFPFEPIPPANMPEFTSFPFEPIPIQEPENSTGEADIWISDNKADF